MIALLCSTLALGADLDLRVGVGLPDLVQVHVGVLPSPAWELHAALGTNLGLITYAGVEAGAVWRPWRWGEGGKNQLALGLGPDLWVGPAPNAVALIGAGSLDLRYERGSDEARVHLVLASRWGLGVTTDLGSEGPGKVEPGLLLQPLQVGVSF